jgi:hypothetical protein
MPQVKHWLFQGNPDRFDINDYLNRYSYIYWSITRHKNEIRLGDPCVIWRSGQKAGAVAIGKIAEVPRPIAEIDYPDCLGDDLWRQQLDSPETIKVGIKVEGACTDETTGFVSRQALVENPVLSCSLIIRNPQGSVFRLTSEQFREILNLWHRSFLSSLDSGISAVEGAKLVQIHQLRERSPALIEKKKADFSAKNGGRVFCELFQLDFSQVYPAALGNGFIEVHHVWPLSSTDLPRCTKLQDLLLICSNCHSMVHRTKEAEANLKMLRDHFSTTRPRLA